MYTYTRANPCVYTYDIRPQTKPVPTYIMNAAFAAPGTVTGVIPTKSRALNIHGALEQTRSAGSPPLFARLLAEEGREKSCRSGQSHPGRTACLGARDGGGRATRRTAAGWRSPSLGSRFLQQNPFLWARYVAFFFFFSGTQCDLQKESRLLGVLLVGKAPLPLLLPAPGSALGARR